MKKVLTPKFHVGDIFDISLNNLYLPNRIKIEMVYMKLDKDEWYYNVRVESDHSCYTISESNLVKSKSYKRGKCYQNPDVISRYKDGYRYCGNFRNDTVYAYAQKLGKFNNIKNIRIYPALSPNGDIIKNYSSIWIKYHNPFYLHDNEYNNDSFTQIK